MANREDNSGSEDGPASGSPRLPQVTYYPAVGINPPVTAWHGIRPAREVGQYLITGASHASGLLFRGTIDRRQGVSYSVNYPGAAATIVRGPETLEGSVIRLVGEYRTAGTGFDAQVKGFVFEGTSDELTSSGSFRTVNYPGAVYNSLHSTMGGLAVFNSVHPHANGSGPRVTGCAHIYHLALGSFTPIPIPGAVSVTAYGIWRNGPNSYTISGGFSTWPLANPERGPTPTGQAYLTDYNPATGQFANFKSCVHPPEAEGQGFVSQFEGISGTADGAYTPSATAAQMGAEELLTGSFVRVRRQPDGTFGDAVWLDLEYPGVPAPLTANSVCGDAVVGLVLSPKDGPFAFQATVRT